MSLINEALKKAQKQRTGESPSLASVPAIGGERPVRPGRRTTSTGFGELLLKIGLGLAALVVVIVGSVYLFRHKTPEPVVTAPPATTASAPVSVAPPVSSTPAAPVTPAPVAPTPAPVVTATTPPAPASTFVVPNVTPPATSASAPAKSEPIAAPPRIEPARTVAVPSPVPVAEAPKPEAAKPAGPLKLEPRAINYIEGIRVAGIRSSTTDSKVLMNDRVYRAGDMVEHEMGLKLVGITSSSLTFEDERGARYTRNF